MQLDTSKRDSDAALLRLHAALAARNRPQPGSFSALDRAGVAEYMREAKRRSRARQRAAEQAGSPAPSRSLIRDALADAALMILAVGAPGAPMVRAVLGNVFHARPGVTLSVESAARAGRLRPKLEASTRKEGDR